MDLKILGHQKLFYILFRFTSSTINIILPQKYLYYDHRSDLKQIICKHYICLKNKQSTGFELFKYNPNLIGFQKLYKQPGRVTCTRFKNCTK